MSMYKVPPKILLVKLSSLGDVLHNLPIVWDLRAQLPEAQIDWIVEEAYVSLLAPLLSREGFRGIDHIIPFFILHPHHQRIHTDTGIVDKGMDVFPLIPAHPAR